jgi:hyperosmotically inducible protein
MTQQQSWRYLVGLIVCVVGLSAHVAALSADQDKTPPKQERGVGRQITDGWITMKVHAQFVTEDALDGSDIDVDTTNGVVTLTGTVATQAGRARALAVAKATDGVKSVTDKLRITPEASTAAGAKEAGRDAAAAAKQGGRRVNDGWIKSKIYAQFLTEDSLENSDIDLTVKGGVVTLSGVVSNATARSRAIAIAKGTEGVKDVKDSLKVSK